MKQFWEQYKKWVVAGCVVVAVLVAVAVFLFVTQDRPADEPVVAEVTSAWPAADSEPVVPQPPEPVRWPLTGLDVAPDEDPSAFRIVAVKIENSPVSRPQTGLDRADVVYEALTEGGITRFNALFHSQTPPEIGPVRSARMSDVQLVPQYGALFANSGSNTGVMSALRSAGIENMNHGNTGAAYWRVRDRAAPHNLHVDISKLREAAAARGYSATQRLDGLAFSSSIDSANVVTRLTVPFSPQNSVVWTYDAATNLYARANNGQPHVDKASGAQYMARNVVVLWAQTSATGPTGIGGRTLEISLVGTNRASVFRDGVRVDCTWEASADKPPVFRDPDGRVVRLGPGVTWFQVIPTNGDIVME